MKSTFLQSPVIVLQHTKNSAWAIEKLCIKTCVRKRFYASHKHNFYPCLDEIQGSKKHSGTWLHPTRLHSGEDQSFQLHIRRRKSGVNKTANSENIFKTGHLSNMGDPLTFHVIRKSKHDSS